MQERLQKIIARAGIASRRKAEELIEEGRVTVNGRVASLGTKADPRKDHIKVNGKLITRVEKTVYLALHKPAGVVTTLSDPEGRPTVAVYTAAIKERIYPVGRLDFHSEGLILMTNDGRIAERIMHPSRKVPKKYRIKVRGVPTEGKLDRLRKGVRLEDGDTLPSEIKRVDTTKGDNNTWLAVTIYEGRNRQIRRMFDHIGHPVMKLKRLAIDGISLGGLKPGEYRFLKDDELSRLKKEIGIRD